MKTSAPITLIEFQCEHVTGSDQSEILLACLNMACSLTWLEESEHSNTPILMKLSAFVIKYSLSYLRKKTLSASAKKWKHSFHIYFVRIRKILQGSMYKKYISYIHNHMTNHQLCRNTLTSYNNHRYFSKKRIYILTPKFLLILLKYSQT